MRKLQNSLVTALALGVLTLGCASFAPQKSPFENKISDAQYKSILDQYTNGKKAYDGFYQTYQADATLMNSEVSSAVLLRRGEFLGWDENKLRQEREKNFQEMSNYSKVFLSFFLPERTYNDLHKATSIWKTYLEFNGQRYEGKVTKIKSKLIELQKLYPHMDRFRTPYEVKFNVPMNSIENSKVRFIVTSSLGTATFEFPPVNSN